MLPVYRLKQRFNEAPCISDVTAHVQAELNRIELGKIIQPGSKVAICVGSRGIVSITEVVTETIRFIKSCPASPFIIPAMGSHGGGTAEGQLKN